MIGKVETIAVAIALGAAPPAALAAFALVDTLHLIAAIGGGIVGSLITARAAFDKTNPTPAFLVALNCTISLTLGALAGLFAPPVLLQMFNQGIAANVELMRGLGLLFGLGGEKITSILLAKVMTPISLPSKGGEK